MLILDASAMSFLAERTRQSVASILTLKREGLWPPTVPSVVLVECLTGQAGRDTPTNRLLKTCDLAEEVPEAVARRAAKLRTLANRGSAVDAIVVAMAEPGGRVLTSDPVDLRAIAAHANGVNVERT